jgi:hypothetical protein
MNDQKIPLSVALVNGIVQYLGTRPYAEVVSLIVAIQEQASAAMAANPPADDAS